MNIFVPNCSVVIQDWYRVSRFIWYSIISIIWYLIIQIFNQCNFQHQLSNINKTSENFSKNVDPPKYLGTICMYRFPGSDTFSTSDWIFLNTWSKTPNFCIRFLITEKATLPTPVNLRNNKLQHWIERRFKRSIAC